MNKIHFSIATLLLLLAFTSCALPTATPVTIDRLSTLPAGALKGSPENDNWPPVATFGWSRPEPMPGPINTVGGEDSPFLTSDGLRFFFFFTPDVHIPAEKSILDGVSGIWVATRSGETWSEPARVHLADPGEPALDGCEFVQDDWMVFCSARKGNYRTIDLYTAIFRDGAWEDWQNWGRQINVTYEVGEMHVTADGQELYFASSRAGGYGGYDLWVSQKTADGWEEPVNLGAMVNTAGDENRPFISADGQELWFDSSSRKGRPGPAIFRSARQADGTWGPPEEIVSTFAGEPTLSANGRTLYFVHHYFSPDLSQMIEADIYMTTRP